MADGAGQGLARPGEIAPGVSAYAPELAEAICRRVIGGESLRRICRDPGMPHRATLAAWRNAHPEFAEALAAAQQSARLAVRRRDQCKRLAWAARPKPPRGGRRSAYSPEVGEAICRRLMEGESLTAIARDPDMPSYGAILKWVARHREFQDAYTIARQVQADYLFDEARDVALATTPQTVWADRLRFDVIRWQTARLSPRKYVERMVVLQTQDELRRQAAEDAHDESHTHRIYVTHFERGPNGKILAIPPRNAEEEASYQEAYGRPYDGPQYQTVERDR